MVLRNTNYARTMSSSPPIVSERKPNRRGYKSRQRAAEKFRAKQNDLFKQLLQNERSVVMSATRDISTLSFEEQCAQANEVFEAMERMSKIRYAAVHSTDYPPECKYNRVRVGTSDPDCVRDNLICLPDPSPTMNHWADENDRLLIVSEQLIDEGYCENEIQENASEQLIDACSFEDPEESDYPSDVSEASEIDLSSLDLRVESSVSDVQSVQTIPECVDSNIIDSDPRLLKQDFDDDKTFEEHCKQNAMNLKWAKKSHRSEGSVAIATIDVGRKCGTVLVYIPRDFKINQFLDADMKFRSYKFCTDLRYFNNYLGYKIYVCHHSHRIVAHANVYIKYTHPGQVIFCVNSIPFIHPEYYDVSLTGLRC